MSAIQNRYEFVLLFDVKDGNPNGDPDAGNLPRVDAETGMGLVTDVCLKRKVRNFVQMTKNKMPGFDIFVKEKGILNHMIAGAYADLGINLEEPPKDPKDGKKRNTKGEGQGSEVGTARTKMCEKFFDIRTFGAVLSTGANAGQVRGPAQFTFGRSIEPVVSSEHSITRMAVATDAEAEKQGGDNRTMGRKFTIPYGLYRSHGFISAPFGEQTGFSDDDLNLLWDALKNMFDHDRSAARGQMATRKLVVFKHKDKMGNAPAQDLFELVKVSRSNDTSKPAREFSDYVVSVDKGKCPQGVEILEKV
jgi:CRISPR-associated protein Csd2